jgi:hypothetical protein
LTPPDAHNPDAVEALQRPITIDLVYPRRMRCWDKRHGRQDALIIQNAVATAKADGGEFTTPWLEAIGQEWLAGCELERNPSTAMFGVHDREIVALEQRRRTLVRSKKLAIATADAIQAQGPAHGVQTVQEVGAPEQVVERRRGREHAARVAQQESSAQSALKQIGDIDQRLAELQADRTTHWRGLLVRVAATMAFTERRRQTYLRAGLRKAQVKAPVPDLVVLPAPQWFIEGTEPPIAGLEEGVDHDQMAA